MKQKGQSEIVGLLIIVVIISMAMMFYLSYAITRTDESTNENLQKRFVDNELSMSYVQALITMNIPECQNLPLDLIIKDCGLQENIISCSGLTTCQAVELVLETIKNQTLDVWDRAYALSVDYNSTEVPTLVFTTYGCYEGTVGRRAPGVQYVPYYPVNNNVAALELALCEQ